VLTLILNRAFPFLKEQELPKMADEQAPLIRRGSNTSVNKKTRSINLENWLYPHTNFDFQSSREATRHYLSSKAGHYFVLGLVSLDVSAIIAGMILFLTLLLNDGPDY
jgi:hypothetical protein